jgi:hypothetical protein
MTLRIAEETMQMIVVAIIVASPMLTSRTTAYQIFESAAQCSPERLRWHGSSTYFAMSRLL